MACNISRRLLSAFLGAASISGAAGVKAQEYPVKVINIVVPAAAGGRLDRVAGLLAIWRL